MRVPNGVPTSRPVVAVDPGHSKCGIAVVAPDGEALSQDIILTAMIGETTRVLFDDHKARAVVIGTGTTADEVTSRLLDFFDRADIVTVDEHNTTLQARTLYRQENPPGCMGRIIPTGLLIPPRPLDDYAAVIIGRRYFAIQDTGDSQ